MATVTSQDPEELTAQFGRMWHTGLAFYRRWAIQSRPGAGSGTG